MTPLAGVSAGGGHPAWHLLVVAVGSVGVFVGIKAWEWWHASAQRREQQRHAGPCLESRITARPYWSPKGSALIVGVALASAGCAVVHAAAGPAHFREATAFGAFFLAAAALQGTWALLVIRRVTRALLKIGAFGNTAVLLLWAVTRTVGLPIGPDAWHAEAVAPPDAFASLLEVMVVLGAAVLLFGRQPSPHGTKVASGAPQPAPV
jgi:hypothetical protein